MAGAAMRGFTSSMAAMEGRHDTAGRAILAKLRTHTGNDIADDPELWGMSIEWISRAVDRHNANAGDRWILPGRRDDDGLDVPTPTERAVAAALTMYAAMSRNGNRMPDSPGTGFGTALRRSSRDDDKGMIRAVQILFASDSFDELAHHLVSLMPRMQEGFDYAAMADSLVSFQIGPRRRSSVLAAWSRQYHRPPSNKDDGARNRKENE